MAKLQEIYLLGTVSMEPAELQAFQETRQLPTAVFERGVTFESNAKHFVPANASETGEDMWFGLEETLTLTASFIEEAEAEDEEPEDDEETEEESYVDE